MPEKCSACGKVPHPTREAAQAHLRWLQRQRGANSDLRVYPCGKRWHVGHSQVALRKRIRRALGR